MLWHTYELTDDFDTHDEDKLIGVFSSKQIHDQLPEPKKKK